MSRDGRCVAIANNKGGAHKTTWCKELAAALARRGHNVLVIDMDPQANLTRRMGIIDDPAHPIPTVSEAIKQDQEGCIAGAIVACGWNDPTADNIDVVPSRIDLELRVSEAATLGAVLRLRRALAGVGEDYDWILMDCAPSMGHLTHMALAAADAVVIPIIPEYDHVTGGRRMVEFIAAYRDQIYSPQLEPLAVLVGGLRETTALHSFHIEGLPEVFPGLLWEPAIPHRIKIAEAQDKATPVHAYDRDLARELVPRYDAIAAHLEGAMA